MKVMRSLFRRRLSWCKSMRKNAVNRKLHEITGGVCAPEGFWANGVACGISQEEGRKDLALVVADRRCPAACVFSTSATQSVTAKISKKHLKNGIARAVLINSGTANIFLPNGEWIAERVCRILSKNSTIEVNETLLASTGIVGGTLTIDAFERGIPQLVKGLSNSEEGSFSAAQAIMTVDKEPKQAAFEFNLGDFPCKIGVIYKGTARVCPNMATVLAVMTTDVNISSKMLQKALVAAVKDTFNSICIDGISSPNDMASILANGKAGNYQIFCEDSEYEKFVYALREVLSEVSRRIVKEGSDGTPLLMCKVSGAKSKQLARTLAKSMVCSSAIKSMLLKGEVGVTDLIYLINCVMDEVNYGKARISLQVDGNACVLFDSGRVFALSEERAKDLCLHEKINLLIELQEGNFSAQALGILRK